MMQMDRNKVLKKHLSLSILFKGMGMLLLYMTIPLLLDYLGDVKYGLWVTIFSIINWFYYFDVGIGNGLKNKLTEALATNDLKKASEYISTAFFSTSILSVLIFLSGLLLIYNLELHSMLNVNMDEAYLKRVFLIVLIFLSLSFVLNLYKPLFFSAQKASLVQLSIFVFQLLILALVVVLRTFFDQSLMLVALIFGGCNVLIGFVFNAYYFSQNGLFSLRFRNFKVKRIKEIMGIGLDFFIIQLCLIFILTTDNIIIANLIGPEKVTVYDSVFKIFQVFLVGNTLILTPFWAMYTDAYIKKDFAWIKKTLKRMNLYFLCLLVFLGFVVVFFDFIIEAWLGKDLDYSVQLLWLMAIFVLIRGYGDLYIYFLNGAGKIQLQKRLFILGALINVPLSVILIKHYHFGMEGVMIATIVSLAGLAIIMPIQAIRIVNKGASNGT
jgi:O-antigen/teichoic acid export membrane protein